MTYLFGSRFEFETVDSVAGHPVPIPQVITEGMPQVVIIPDVGQHGHDPLESTVDKCPCPGYDVAPSPVPIIPLLRIATVQRVVQVKKVQLVGDVGEPLL